MRISDKKLEIMLARKMINKRELSEISGITTRSITRCTRQEVTPLLVGKIAKALEVDVLEIIEDRGE